MVEGNRGYRPPVKLERPADGAGGSGTTDGKIKPGRAIGLDLIDKMPAGGGGGQALTEALERSRLGSVASQRGPGEGTMRVINSREADGTTARHEVED